MYKVLTAELQEHAQRDVLEDAMNVAATHMRSSPNAVAVVVTEAEEEALLVLHNNYVYLAQQEEAKEEK